VITDGAPLAGLLDAHTRDLLLITDAHERVCYANHSARKALFRPDDALQGKPLGDLLLPITLGGVDFSGNRSLEQLPGFRPGDRLVALQAPEPRIFYGFYQRSEARWQGQTAHVHSISPLVVDPFEYVRTQASLAIPLQALNSAPFLLELAHEIKNGLHRVLGLLEQAPGGGPAGPSKAWHQQLGLAAEQLAGLAHDLGDISRLQKGDFSLRCADFPLRSSLQALVQGYQDRLQGEDLQVLFDYQGTEDWVHADGQRILQIAQNLIDNAVGFTDRGSVSVEVHLQAWPERPQQRHLRLKVRDTGIGLPEGFRIGDAGARHSAAHRLRQRHPGSGIGLTLCERLCKQMAGRILAQNTPQGGAVIEASLFVQAAQSAPASPPPVRQALLGARILLVDDAPWSNDLLARWLREAGAVPTTVSDGLQALQALDEGPQDLVLMDACLPGLDGTSTTRRIRQSRRQVEGGPRQLPIIGLTGQVDPMALQQLRQAGMDAVLSKPIARAELLQVLQRHLARPA
jgi:signal transduction histidine kinase/ActR/RegA family two-component response regulator